VGDAGGRATVQGAPELLLESIAQGEPVTTQRGHKVPAALRPVLRVGLSPQPGERYENMDTLVEALLEQTKPEAAEVLVVPGAAQPEQPARRGIFFMATVVAGAAVLGALASAALPETLASAPRMRHSVCCARPSTRSRSCSSSTTSTLSTATPSTCRAPAVSAGPS
jgi:hypothetical protein